MLRQVIAYSISPPNPSPAKVPAVVLTRAHPGVTLATEMVGLPSRLKKNDGPPPAPVLTNRKSPVTLTFTVLLVAGPTWVTVMRLLNGRQFPVQWSFVNVYVSA